MALFSGSCHSIVKKDYTSFINAKKSFVKIDVYLILSVATSESKEGDRLVSNVTASGAIVSYMRQKHILTAAHVCDHKDFLEYASETLPGSSAKIEISAVNLEGKKHDAYIVKLDHDNDLCLLKTEGIDGPALKLSPTEPEVGEKLYNFAAPVGFFKPPTMPILEGRYSGLAYDDTVAISTIPAIGGSSGSPVVNHKGELVGTIYAVHKDFEHIALGPPYKELKKFLDDPVVSLDVRIIKSIFNNLKEQWNNIE